MTCATCRNLAERNERLEAELATLKADLLAHHWEAPREFGLSWTQERILAVLLRHDRIVPYESIFAATRTPNSRLNVDSGKLVMVLVCKLRRQLAPFGIEIETMWGAGYRLSADSRRKLMTWASAEQAA